MSDLDVVRERVSADMDRIMRNFKFGAKIAVLVWFPDLPERDFVLTNGELSEATAVIQRSMTRESAAHAESLIEK